MLTACGAPQAPCGGTTTVVHHYPPSAYSAPAWSAPAVRPVRPPVVKVAPPATKKLTKKR